MASDSQAKRWKKIEDMDLISQQKEIIKALKENTKAIEKLKEKIAELAREV